MGIEYRRPEMTLSALARDTARIGVLLTQEGNPTVQIEEAPADGAAPAFGHEARDPAGGGI